MPLNRLFLPVLALTSTLGLAHAQETPSRDQVVATVNGTEITLGHMLVLRAGLPPEYAQVPPDTLFNGILNQLVQQTVLEQSNEGDPSPQTQLMIENELRAIRASEVIGEITSQDVSDEAIEAFYKENYSGPETEYRASHILVETEEAAKDLIAKLGDGAEFIDLAKEFSTGPSGPGGGDLGWFGEGTMVEPFFEAVKALDVGAVSDPVQTQFGWHVIQLNETRDAEVPPLDELKDSIADTLRAEALDARIAELEEAASIDRIEPGTIDPAVINDATLLEN
jgi:peptidyl-prolyl cis-trans isomerase C